jgi:membrane fusion protein (multidrug efflux system)
MVKRFIIAIILLGLVGGGLVGFNLFRDKMIAQFFAGMTAPPATVSTVEAKAGDWTPVIEGIGTVNAARGVELTVETAGVVKEIRFKPGAYVKAGDVLLRLDDVVQQADVSAARSADEQAQTNLTRARELAGRGVASNVSLDQTESAARATAAQLARAEAVLAQRQLTAPFDGVVGLTRVDPGQYVAPGTIIATLQDASELRVDFSLPEQNLPDLRVGQKIAVHIDGEEAPFLGALTGIDPRVEPSTRLVALRGSVPNAGGRIAPGQFVRIDVILPTEVGVISLPQTAISNSLYGDFVYLVQPKADAAADAATPPLEVRQVFVKTGRRTGGLVEVSGIDPGAQVVSAGQNRLSNGQPASVNNDVNPAAAATGPAVTGANE